jgi:hypothetical protein
MSSAPVAPPPTGSSTRGSAVAITIVGALLALAGAVALLAAAGLGVAQLTLRDDDGYFTSPRAHLATASAAIVGDDLSLGDVDDGASADVVDALSVRARITATRRDGADVFIGVGPAAAVRSYLAGAPFAEFDEVRNGDVVLREHSGGRSVQAPTRQTFWVASAEGSGRRQLTWKPTSGRWAAVVMNADASRGIDVDVRVGARIGSVPWIAAGIGAVGLILLLGGGVLLFVGLRSQSQPAAAVDVGSAPAA